MDLFDVLSLIGGLALFLFGMQMMGNALEKKAGGQLKTILGKMTDNPIKGFLLGLGVTAVIQSSSATTVMVVGFVNSGLISLRQAIRVIMGANIGTTVTAWILSLASIDSSNMWVQLLKPTSFTPVLALIGIILFMFVKSSKKKDTGMILLSFAVLMTGMDIMSGAVAGLKDVPEFTRILTLFANPIFGVLAGAVLTGIIQSSSASVGILQALSSTGTITYATAIPIIMGQNIGTCVTAMLSSIGANKNARRAAFVHLYFNIIGTTILLTVFTIVTQLVDIPFIQSQTDELGIAVVHTTFNILTTILLFPMARLLEKLACMTVRDSKEKEEIPLLDERLLATPSIATEQCENAAEDMAEVSANAMKQAMSVLFNYDKTAAEDIRKKEEIVDKYEDSLGSYLVKLSATNLSGEDNSSASTLLHIIGDVERISDHAVNILESAEEIADKKLNFSEQAKNELNVMMSAVSEILDMAVTAFANKDLALAAKVEPLEQTIDELKDQLKRQHIARLQKGNCTIELGFILSDILTNLERVADHCSNIAGSLLEMTHDELDIHAYLRGIRNSDEPYHEQYKQFKSKYALN